MSPSPALSLVRDLYLRGDAAHDFDHVLRVTRLAVHIARAEGADVTVARWAALLHDVPVADSHRDGHHHAAADFAGRFLAEQGLDSDRIANVVHCIRAHRFRDASLRPQTLEARCLYDADKLDSMGAMGVARTFAHAGAHRARLWTTPWTAIHPEEPPPVGPDYTPVHEFVYKLRRLPDTLYTDTGRRLARERQATMQAFFDALDREMAFLTALEEQP